MNPPRSCQVHPRRVPFPGDRAGFTLLELILVLALILVVAAVVTPRMADFFRGRVLDNEARRFLTLTRYGQSRAVAEGVPMLVWIDPQQRRYGLAAQPGYLERDDRAVEYQLADPLEIEVGNPVSGRLSADADLLARQLPGQLRIIRFTPDGFLGEASPERVLLRRGERDALILGPGRNWQQYEMLTNEPHALLR